MKDPSITKALLCHHSPVFREMFAKPEKDQLGFLRAKLSSNKIKIVARGYGRIFFFLLRSDQDLNLSSWKTLLEFMQNPAVCNVSDYAGTDRGVFCLASLLEVSSYMNTVIESLRRLHVATNGDLASTASKKSTPSSEEAWESRSCGNTA